MPVIAARTIAPQILSNKAQAAFADQREKMLWSKLAVITPVTAQEGKFEVFGSDFFLPNADLADRAIRTARSAPATVSAGTTLVSYKCLPYALQVKLDRELEIDHAVEGGLQNPLPGDVLVATNTIAYKVESDIITAVTSGSVTNTAAAAALWTDYTNAAYDPVGDVRARADVLYNATGYSQEQLTLYLGNKAARAVRQSDPIRQTYFGGAAAKTELTNEMLAAAFGVKEVVVSTGMHSTAGSATANLSTTAVLAYVSEEAQGNPQISTYATAIRWLQYTDLSYTAYTYDPETHTEGGQVGLFGVKHVVSYDLLGKITSVVS